MSTSKRMRLADTYITMKRGSEFAELVTWDKKIAQLCISRGYRLLSDNKTPKRFQVPQKIMLEGLPIYASDGAD